MLARRIPRIIFDKRAVSNVISTTILTGVVIALSLSMFTWAQGRTSVYNNEYRETVDAETAKLKEKLAFEYVYYHNSTQKNVTIYLLNCGTIDGVQIKTVYIYDSSGALCFEPFSEPPLYSFQSWDEISDLDRGEEGRLVLTLPDSGLSSGYYNVKVVTVRGATFDQGFVA
ncbi:hypothetical protein E3J74_06675 [Candidatus Bathyarchaeota archaeon]|nr:MAG: hypothetical protein E3J74_06675 [Candidatus Bathyarchaeota archaeon]